MSGNGLSRETIYKKLRASTWNKNVADDGYIDLKSGIAGTGWVMAGDNEEFLPFTFTTAGVVTLLTDVSTNTANTDSDGNLCAFDNGSNVRIRNRLGSTKLLRVKVEYS